MSKYFVRQSAAAVVFAVSSTPLMAAPIVLTPTSASYSQNFDGLSNAANATSVGFTNDSTIPGFWAGQGGATPFPAVTAYTVTDGTDGNFTSVGSLGTAGASDRAFGSRNASATGTIRYGFVFQNTSSDSILDTLTVTYTGEEWRQDISKTATATDDTLAFSYRVFATAPVTADSSVLSGTVTNVPSLNFVPPQQQLAATTGAHGLDGNAAADRTTLSATLTGLNVLPNQYIVIRWNDADIAGNDNADGIDDLAVGATFTSTPEPAMLGTVAIGGGLMLKRRRTSTSSR